MPLKMVNLGFCDSFSQSMLLISSFHDQAMVIILFIVSVVLYILVSVFSSSFVTRSVKSSEFLETVWTVLPCVVLAALAAPSLVTLYISEEVKNPTLTLKVIGHQWYWSYEYGNSGVEFDSYMIPSSELTNDGFRLLECDNRIFLPIGLESQLIISSADVIHSWTLPSLGVKLDAIPGRLNQLFVNPYRIGVSYGQCSEICGSLHSFMPICLEVIPLKEFISMVS